MRTIKLNILAPFIIGFLIWAGVTGHVSWWVLAAITLSHAELNIVIKI